MGILKNAMVKYRGIDCYNEPERCIGKYAAIVNLPFEGNMMLDAFDTPQEAMEEAIEWKDREEDERISILFIVRIEIIPKFEGKTQN